MGILYQDVRPQITVVDRHGVIPVFVKTAKSPQQENPDRPRFAIPMHAGCLKTSGASGFNGVFKALQLHFDLRFVVSAGCFADLGGHGSAPCLTGMAPDADDAETVLANAERLYCHPALGDCINTGDPGALFSMPIMRAGSEADVRAIMQIGGARLAAGWKWYGRYPMQGVLKTSPGSVVWLLKQLSQSGDARKLPLEIMQAIKLASTVTCFSTYLNRFGARLRIQAYNGHTGEQVIYKPRSLREYAFSVRHSCSMLEVTGPPNRGMWDGDYCWDQFSLDAALKEGMTHAIVPLPDDLAEDPHVDRIATRAAYRVSQTAGRMFEFNLDKQRKVREKVFRDGFYENGQGQRIEVAFVRYPSETPTDQFDGKTLGRDIAFGRLAAIHCLRDHMGDDPLFDQVQDLVRRRARQVAINPESLHYV